MPADLPAFAPARAREVLAALRQAKIQNPKSKISACPPGELSLVFLTDAALAALHADFMNDPSTTDVITFEGDATAGLAGEICVSADTAAAYAREHGRDFATELTLYLVHGWLHLAGYDDLRPAKKRRMRAAEARALKILSAHAAIPGFRVGPPAPSRSAKPRRSRSAKAG
ncbi:MAG: rRNA maturation RNase YbeY [Opitutus sp.]|nr:rRNA maturation RNase YbeY [Opitutus sp.]